MARGAQAQAIGISRGGRTSKLRALSDADRRSLAFLLTGGQAANCRAAEGLLSLLPCGLLVIADRGYDTDAVRNGIESRGSVPNIPPKSNRRWEPLLQSGSLPRPQCDRTHVRTPERFSPDRHTLRQTRHQLPRRGLPRSNHELLVASPRPRAA